MTSAECWNTRPVRGQQLTQPSQPYCTQPCHQICCEWQYKMTRQCDGITRLSSLLHRQLASLDVWSCMCDVTSASPIYFVTLFWS
jgi:hypothetical protein